MKTRKTRTSTESSDNGELGTDGGSNVTRLDDVRRTRNPRQEPTEIEKTPDTERSSEDTTPVKRNRRFNQEKVDRLKAAIATGDYEVDAERVAHKFIEHDRRH